VKILENNGWRVPLIFLGGSGKIYLPKIAKVNNAKQLMVITFCLDSIHIGKTNKN